MPASNLGGGAAEDLWGARLEGSSSTPPAAGAALADLAIYWKARGNGFLNFGGRPEKISLRSGNHRNYLPFYGK
jgi:hypothetical protein